jgi:Flp pilus assembly protein TadG
MNRPHRARPWRAIRDDDRGSAAAELVVLTPLLIILLLFVVFCGRVVDRTLRLTDAAHQAARTASIERTPAMAAKAAQSTASAALSSAGVKCNSLTVDTATGSMRPGGTVSVTISCTIDLNDALFLGVPGHKHMAATAVEPVDVWRSGAGNLPGSRS